MPRKGTKQVIGQVTLYQRGRTWQASYTTPELGRKRVSLKVTNLKEAQKKAKEIDELIQRGEFVTLKERRRAQRMTFEEFITEFEQKFKNWADNTWRANNSTIKVLKAEWGGCRWQLSAAAWSKHCWQRSSITTVLPRRQPIDTWPA